MAACKLLCLVIVFAFVTQGYGYGEFYHLHLTQSKTGKMIQNKPEWEVEVTNPTPCTFSNTKLSCTGFKSITTINSSVLSKPGDDDACLLHTGYNDRLRGGEHVAFKYVWDPRYDFKIASTEIACS